MDQFTLSQQALLFSNARLVVGPHGSAFVNMIWCNSSASIIEFFGPGYISGHDILLAQQCGLSWHYLLGDIDVSSMHDASFDSDYYVDISKLKTIVTDVIG